MKAAGESSGCQPSTNYQLPVSRAIERREGEKSRKKVLVEQELLKEEGGGLWWTHLRPCSGAGTRLGPVKVPVNGPSGEVPAVVLCWRSRSKEVFHLCEPGTILLSPLVDAVFVQLVGASDGQHLCFH